MPSKPLKKPKPKKKTLSSREFAESEIAKVAESLLSKWKGKGPHWVFLEGEMGAGKSTLTRAILHALGVKNPVQGSPTFALAHEYETSRGRVAHMDWYRVKNEIDLEEMGLRDYFSDRFFLVLVEWGSLFPETREKLLKQGQSTQVLELKITGESLRHLSIE